MMMDSVLDPWIYRPEPWISETFAFENAALTKALQISLSESSSSSGPSTAAAIAASIASPETLSAATSSSPPSSSFLLQQLAPPVAGADIPPAGRRRNAVGCAPSGRVSKRKSRASKRSPTTYINADPANFREMVQRVTGVRPGSSEPGLAVSSPVEPVVRPEPQRAAPAVGSRIGASLLQQICLPTLDTSAFFLDRAASTAAVSGGDRLFGRAGTTAVDGPALDFDQVLPAFPTLESWGVM